MLKKKAILFALLMAASKVSLAQCGAGIPSGGNPLCIPPDVYNRQGTSDPQMGGAVLQPVVIQQKWADRWGAISIDGTAGSIGVVTGYASKALAESAALDKCKKSGGKICEKPFAFQNQCAAFIVGENSGNMSRAGDEKTASRLGIAECKKENANCRVYESACSYPEAVPVHY